MPAETNMIKSGKHIKNTMWVRVFRSVAIQSYLPAIQPYPSTTPTCGQLYFNIKHSMSATLAALLFCTSARCNAFAFWAIDAVDRAPRSYM